MSLIAEHGTFLQHCVRCSPHPLQTQPPFPLSRQDQKDEMNVELPPSKIREGVIPQANKRSDAEGMKK